MRASDQRAHNRGRLSRKDLRAPDEFITVTGRVINLVGEHLRTIAFVIGVIIACIIVAWGLLTYLHGVEQAAFRSIWQVEAQLRNAADGAVVPTASVERLQEITHQFGAGGARGYAWLYLGHVHYRQGDYRAAVTAYEQSAALSQAPALLWSIASMGSAYALEASQEFKAAQEAYQRVVDAKPMGFLLEAYLGKARTAEQSQDRETALAAYTAAIEQFPGRAEGLNLADKVEALKGAP
jgi:tetratricopeptide (TPR) repeat protein